MDDFTPGPHLLVDHRGDRGLTDAAALEDAMRGAADTAGATVLSAAFHDLPDGAGVSGALVLAEGHIAVRTWADQDYAAFDIFVPGEGLGKLAADHLARVLLPDWAQIKASTRNSFAPPAS